MTRPPGHRPLRTVVCGTGFGRFYAETVRSLAGEFELVGIVARGSTASQDFADHCAVPLYTSVGSLPRDVDCACVVVGAAVSGGPGSELAQTLLDRGIHVLQEHPVHQDELAATLRVARRKGAAYRLNTFYRHVAPIRSFLSAAAALRRRSRPLFVDATSALQVLSPLLDVVARALGGVRPWGFTGPLARDAGTDELCGTPQPYRVMQGAIAGVPVTLRVQNQIDPADGDNHALLWHRLAIGTDGGVLTLADTHGPVLWSPRLHAPRDINGRLMTTGPGTHAQVEASTTVLNGTEPVPFQDVFRSTWPDAIAHALRGLAADAAAGADPLHTGQFDLAVCRLWHDVTGRLGRPEIIRPGTPSPLGARDLAPLPVAEDR